MTRRVRRTVWTEGCTGTGSSKSFYMIVSLREHLQFSNASDWTWDHSSGALHELQLCEKCMFYCSLVKHRLNFCWPCVVSRHHTKNENAVSCLKWPAESFPAAFSVRDTSHTRSTSVRSSCTSPRPKVSERSC